MTIQISDRYLRWVAALTALVLGIEVVRVAMRHWQLLRGLDQQAEVVRRRLARIRASHHGGLL